MMSNAEFGNIDVSYGIEACGSEELYREIAMEFAQSADDGANEISGYLAQEDYENYTIKVHALKSSARLAGAMALSDEALYLEKCGRLQDIGEIKAKTEALLTHYRDTASEIISMLSVSKDKKRKFVLSQNEFERQLKAIDTYNEDFDYDSIDGIMDNMAEYEIPEEFIEVYNDLKKYTFNVDQENIRLTIKNYTGGNRE